MLVRCASPIKKGFLADDDTFSTSDVDTELEETDIADSNLFCSESDSFVSDSELILDLEEKKIDITINPEASLSSITEISQTRHNSPQIRLPQRPIKHQYPQIMRRPPAKQFKLTQAEDYSEDVSEEYEYSMNSSDRRFIASENSSQERDISVYRLLDMTQRWKPKVARPQETSSFDY